MKYKIAFLCAVLLIALLTVACGAAPSTPTTAASTVVPFSTVAPVETTTLASPPPAETDTTVPAPVETPVPATLPPPDTETATPFADETSAAAAAGPTTDLPQTFVAFDADFFARPCPLFVGDDEIRAYACDFGEYYMLHKQASTRYSYLEGEYADGVVEATGYFNNGSGKYEYGIVFRANTEGTEYYVFTVTNDGRYNVSLYQNQEYTDLIPYTASPLVTTGDDEWNTFKVVMRGERFDFYLNDTFLETVTDDAIASGVVGLFFYNDLPDVEVGFDQLTVSTFSPPSSTATPAPDGTVTFPGVGPTTDLPQTFVAFDADFFAEPCPLFEGDNETREYGCDFGEYYMLHKQATTRYTFYDELFDDAVIEATGYFNGGSGKYEYGIVFRANADGTEYYVFTVTNDRKYNVSLYQDDKYTDLIPYTESSLVTTGADEWNTFQVVMRGERFDFYLNDTFLDTVTDDSIASGYVGLFFYNDTPDAEVGFDQLEISTFEPLPPTATPEPTTSTVTPATPASAPTAPTAPTVPAVAPTVAVRPGVYIAGLRFTPGAPKRGDPITFFATFLNTTGREQHYNWLVEVWEINSDKKNPYGQADNLQRLIPGGANERATGDSFKVGPGGPCEPFRAHVVFVDDQGRRVPFLRTNGTELWVPFQVCP